MSGPVDLLDLFRACVQRRQAAGVPLGQARYDCEDPDSFQWPGTFFRSAESRDLPRWEGQNLVPGFVPVGPDPRTEAHLWAKELAGAGQDPVAQKDAWLEHARWKGFSSPQSEEGWSYVQTVYSEAVQARPQQYKGSYGAYPQTLKGLTRRTPATGWPWATQEAEAIFGAASSYVSSHPDTSVETAIEAGLAKTGLTVFDITPEDDALLSMALTWKLQGKEAEPAPPQIPTARSAYGMKGTQAGAPPLLKRGAP